jgi:hypothetical protein
MTSITMGGYRGLGRGKALGVMAFGVEVWGVRLGGSWAREVLGVL